MKYNTPILSVEHANWCLEEAEKRYCGVVSIDTFGMFLIKQENGITHTDDVLREISFFVREVGFESRKNRGIATKFLDGGQKEND